MLLNRRWLTLALVLLSFTGCHKDDIAVETEVIPADKAILSFSFTIANNPGRISEDIICTVSDSVITAVIPSLDMTDYRDSLVATFQTNGKRVLVNGSVEKSDSAAHDFKQPLTYTVVADDGTEKPYKVVLASFTGLPIVYVTTENGVAITSKDDYVNGHLQISANNNLDFADYEGDMQIRGRGNSTWSMPKKPYKIKLSAKAAVLGMPADKEWVLLANYSDKTLMRNYLAFETSKIMALEYTPRYQFVELVLNGEYVGTYQFGEHLKIAKNRINIQELDEDDVSASKITGGYQLEVDARLDEENWFYTTKGVPFTIKSPDYGVAVQNAYIQNYIQQTEDAIYGSNFTDPVSGYAGYLNRSTVIKWFWVNELFKNVDAIFYSSVNMYKDRDSLLKMGPVWDFDFGAGNVDYNTAIIYPNWYVLYSPWIYRLFEDKAFATEAIQQWQSAKVEIDALINTKIDATAAYLKYAQKANFKRWDILNTYVWPNAVVTGSYQGEIDYMKGWLRNRADWIDAHINELLPASN